MLKRIFYYISGKPTTKNPAQFYFIYIFFCYSYHPLIKTQTFLVFSFFFYVVWFWLLFLMMVVLVVIWITLLVCCFPFISLGCLGNVCQCLKVFLSIINEEEPTIGSSSSLKSEQSKPTVDSQQRHNGTKGVGTFFYQRKRLMLCFLRWNTRGNKFLSAGN